MISIKIHESYRTVIAICDEDLLGKKLEEGKRQLECRETFYKDKTMDEEEAIKLIQYQEGEDATFNIVGPKSIGAAIKAGLIEKEDTQEIQGIPFALTLI